MKTDEFEPERCGAPVLVVIRSEVHQGFVLGVLKAERLGEISWLVYRDAKRVQSVEVVPLADEGKTWSYGFGAKSVEALALLTVTTLVERA